jgi:hypothetical protein
MGPIHGKVGTVIGSSRNGVPYIKGLYKNRTLKVSKKELHNRKKFATAQAWLSPLKNFVRVGFNGYSERSQGFVAAKSWLLKNAFKSEGDGLQIDPALVKVSSGDLVNPKDIAVSQMDSEHLKFTWNTADVGTGVSDQIMMLAYDVEKRYAAIQTTGQFRRAGMDMLKIEPMKGTNFQVYAAFNAADRTRQSESIYLGEFKVQINSVE